MRFTLSFFAAVLILGLSTPVAQGARIKEETNAKLNQELEEELDYEGEEDGETTKCEQNLASSGDQKRPYFVPTGETKAGKWA